MQRRPFEAGIRSQKQLPKCIGERFPGPKNGTVLGAVFFRVGDGKGGRCGWGTGGYGARFYGDVARPAQRSLGLRMMRRMAGDPFTCVHPVLKSNPLFVAISNFSLATCTGTTSRACGFGVPNRHFRRKLVRLSVHR